MSVMDMNSRMAMAEKLSVQQLQQAVQSGSLPAYIGIPLIEQKTKERAQMAAAQQGQQKPPSVAASILQQADEQEQQERGIDELPSNLPTEQDEEVGMAGGGIIAFAEPTEQNNNSLVTDPEKDPRIVALRQDPAYLAFAENATAEGQDPSLVAFLEAGNTPTPRRSPPSRGRYDMNGPIGDTRKLFSSPPSPETASDRAAVLDFINKGYTTGQDITYAGVRGVGSLADYFNRGLRAIGVPEKLAPKISDTYTFNKNSALMPYSDRRTAKKDDTDNKSFANIDRDAGATAPQTQQVDANLDNQMFADIDSNAGITAAPGAKLAPEGTPGAPRTAPTRGAAPPSTLAAAERSDSPAANQATSMLDKYVAMLEKSGEDVGRQKKEALYMALIQGGLGMMGGTSPNAFANIAAGLLPATQAYQQAIAGIRKDDRARVEKLINAGLSKEKFAMELRKLGIEEKRVDALVNFYNAKAGAAGGSGSGDDNKKNIAYNTATAGYQREVGKVDGLIAKIKQDNGMYLDYTGKDKNMLAKKQRLLADISELNKKKDNMYSQYRSYVTDRLRIDTPDFSGASGGGNAPAVGTVKDGYKFKGGNPGDPKSWEKV